jgi:hypothetical protein
MYRLNKNRIRKFLISGAFFFLALLTISVYSMEAQILLTPPGLRPVKDPSLVIPAGYRYPNQLIKLPAYRDASGNPADGWSGRFVDTRRFVSNQSAWIYLRDSDLQQSVSMKRDAGNRSFRFWPAGTTMVIESYQGNAFHKKREALIEIDVISKIKGDDEFSAQVFYPVNWTYARFNPDGSASITSAKVRECHQCHSIAFHLTGDLVFTHFP